MQSAMHEGYEYQDYFSVSIILQLILLQEDAEIIIDRKDFSGDKFDDLKILTPRGSIEYQIKYSDNERSHALTKDDFANGNGHDTALSDLFFSWKNNQKKSNEIKLCLAWNRPVAEDKITGFLRPVQERNMPFSSIAYHFDGHLFWPKEKKPHSSWRKFNFEIQEGHIDREEFLSFCDELTILLELPKASLDLHNPGDLEQVLIRQAEKLGIGIYPNNNLTAENVITKLATEVKHARAMGNRLSINSLIARLGIIMNYGKFDQRFPVDTTHQINLKDEVIKLYSAIQDSTRVILTGNPGAGKSWLVDELINKLEEGEERVIHYNCFQSLNDTLNIERIRVTSFYGNLVAQIIEQYPELVSYKKTLFGADKAELENLLSLIKGKFYIVIDGLDHISREYELNKDSIARSETEIISELMKIDFPDNCHVLVSSQPIDELEQFKDKSFCIFRIDPWSLEQVKSLLKKYQIIDVDLDCDSSISVSGYLLKKSQGNALYLSYILRQLQTKEVTKDIIDEIPDYDINLSNYYTYLYTKVHNTHTVFALCGAHFYLNKNDLMEITGVGEFVSQDLSLLHPLLIENTLSGGFSIYHESFRRFVLSSLKAKNVNIEKNVYGIIIDWLKQKPFFEFDKSFYYLPELLYKVKNDTENIALIESEFVLRAVRDGFSRNHIRKNINYMIRSAGRARNIIALAAASDLLAMLDDLNEFESTGKEYFNAICDIKGADKLNQLMQIDGIPSFDNKTGLMACYISSKAGVTPWWGLYLDTDVVQFDLEDAKYYIRFYLDDRGISIIPKIMKAAEDGKTTIRDQYIEIVYNELVDYIEFEEIYNIAEEQKLIHWKDYLTYIQTGYYTEKNISTEKVRNLFDEIKALQTVGEEDVKVFKAFFSQIYHLAKQGNSSFINEIIFECENINWFYNWIIYCIKLAELSAQADITNSEIRCESIIETLQLLLLDTEVFKGKPRTCDLYFLQHELTMSYAQAIRIVLKDGTLQDIEQAFTILEQLDAETGTSLDHHMGGPLTDAEFLKLISGFLTSDNYDVLKPYLVRIQESIEKNEVYDCIAAAKLRFVSIISKYDFAEACEYFDMCTRYLVAYGFHKDIILEQIMDPYSIYYKNVSEKPEAERDTVTKMTLALFNHTDGRDTKHFLNNWFEKLLETEPRYALSFLSGFQIKHGRSWITEHMIRSAIEMYSDDYQYSAILVSLIESLPNEISPRLINASTKVLKTLLKQQVNLNDEDALLNKKCMKELVINIMSRFNILVEPRADSYSWKETCIKEFMLTAEAAGFDVSQYLDYFHISGKDSMKMNEPTVAITGSNPRFVASALQEAVKWFETHDLIERDVSDICDFLKQYQDDKGTLIEVLRVIINKVSGWNYSDKKKKLVLKIVEQVNLNDKEMAEVHMLLYIGSYEWGSSLIDRDEFLKSIERDSNVAYDTFYRELPEVIISRSGRITKGLIDALFTSGYDKESVATIWKNAFKIMRLRFPNLDNYSIDFVFEETEEVEGLRNCLLTRFVDGGKEQFLAAYAYLVDRAEEKRYLEFTEAVEFCLKYFKQLNLVSQIAIADLLSRYSFKLSKVCQKRLTQTIDKIYPTGNFLLDVLFSEFTIYKSYLCKSLDKHAPDYLEQEDIEFYLAEKMYDLGKMEHSDIADNYAKNSIYRDSVMDVVRKCGIDYEALYLKLHSSKRLNNKIREFISGPINLPEMNTVYKSYAIQYALHAIIEKAYIQRRPEIIPQSLLQLVPDFTGMYRIFKSREAAPNMHLFTDNKLMKKEDIKDLEYTLVGCIEIKRDLDYEKAKWSFVFSGLVLDSIDKDEIPLNQYYVRSFEEGNNYQATGDLYSLINLFCSLDKELEDNYYLWPIADVCEILNLHTAFDFLNGRFVAVNQSQEVVFYMKSWQSCYKGDSDYTGYAIPLYMGTALYIKTDYLTILQEHYGTLRMKIKEKSLVQTY